MTFDPFTLLLRDASVSSLETIGVQIDTEIGRLREQREAVERELRSRRSSQSSDAKTPRPRGKRNSATGDQKREAIKLAVASKPDAQWLPVDLERALAQAGVPATRDSIRQLARRMVDEHELARHSSGMGFTGTASANGSGQEPLTEATT